MRGGRDRRGVSAVELLVVALVGFVLMGAIHRFLVVNQRAFGSQSAAVRGQQSLRAAAAVLGTEVRELSPAGGDLLGAGSDTLRIRSSGALGVVCSIQSGGTDPVVRARKTGRFLRGDSARVLYDNNPNSRHDDEWRTALLEPVDTTGSLTCAGGRTAQDVRLRGVVFGAPPDSIVPGSPIRSFEHRVYALTELDGRPYLARRRPGDDVAQPVVGPLDPDGGLAFRYLDGMGDPAASLDAVRQIEVTLRTATDFRGRNGEQERDSLTVRLHTRN